MDILKCNFDEINEADMLLMQEKFNDIGKNALYLDHYELSERTNISPIDWKKFLTDTRVNLFLTEELRLLQKSKVRAMMKDIEKSKSPGQAQLLNTLITQAEVKQNREGPIFIYSYIPLSKEEQHASNTEVLKSDPFETIIG